MRHAVEVAQARQDNLQEQLTKYADSSLHLQHLLDGTAANLTASLQREEVLETHMTQLVQQRDHIAATMSVAERKLQELEPLPPRLAKASREAEVCRKEMNTLTGSQVKVHESLQAYLHQEKELRQGLIAAEQHLSRLSQDYAVCQDTSSKIWSQAERTKVTQPARGQPSHAASVPSLSSTLLKSRLCLEL